MIGLLVGLLALSWVFGWTRGLLGGLVGGFLGALVLIGMASTASKGELAALYTPAQLALNAVPIAVVASLLALVVPYAAGLTALGWGAGALLAALIAPRTGQAIYILPLAAHILAAAAVIWLARWRAPPLYRGRPGPPSEIRSSVEGAMQARR